MVQKLVQNYLFQRGNIFYFRYVLPQYIRELCPQLPTEIKRSLRTDSHTTALALVSAKLPLIRILRDCVGRESVEGVLRDISDFKSPFQIETNKPYIANETKSVPLLSGAWSDFSNWKSWTEKQLKANQRMFNNLIHLLGDVPVDKVTKSDIKIALNHIARLPQRNKKNYAQMDTQELLRMDIPEGDLVSGKYVKEHLKLCQSLFSRYLKHELDILSQSPTEGLRYEYQDNRYAALNDEQVRAVLKKSTIKQSWFKWFISLSVYSGARRSEILGLHKSDFHYCSDSNRYFFHIKQGKTKAAIRVVPIHQKLIKDGVLDWVKSCQDELLFNVSPNKVTGLFNTLFEERVNYLGERIVLHSLRHTFITKARAAGVSNVLVQQVVGHEKSGAGQTDRYTHTFHLKDVLPVVDNVSY